MAEARDHLRASADELEREGMSRQEAATPSPSSVIPARVWRTCSDSAGGECVGGWDETKAPAFVVLGAIFLFVGVAALVVHLLLRRRYSDLELTPRVLNIGAELSLAALGVTLLVGGATRSALDASWHWVPLWLSTGLGCLGAALLLERLDKRRKKQEDWIPQRPVFTPR